jgi:hypothetical protein
VKAIATTAALICSASSVSAANAEFRGFAALVRQAGNAVLIDVYAATGNAGDRFLNVYNVNACQCSGQGFYQAPGIYSRGWLPDQSGMSSTRDSIDSFVTAGTAGGSSYGGSFFASTIVAGDQPSWPTSPATPCLINAGWYTGDPTAVDNNSQLLAPLSGGNVRFDSLACTGIGATPGSTGSMYGIWVAHLVVANASLQTLCVTWDGWASVKQSNGSVSQGYSCLVIPAPAALACLLGVPLFARSRRRPGCRM